MANLLTKMIAASLFLAAAGSSQAHVVDFDSLVGPANNNLYFGGGFGPLITNGYNFDVEHIYTLHGHLINNPAACAGGCADDGTQYLGGNMANLMMKLVNGAPFSVMSFDAAKAYYTYNRPSKIVVDGIFAGGGTISQTFTLPSDNFGSFTLVGFTGLSKVTFRGADANGTPGDLWIGVDNIAVVPEPATYGMLLAGLAAVGLRARRRC